LRTGEFHSGEVLAKGWEYRGATVCNALADVAQWGVALQRIRGRGYRLKIGAGSRWMAK